MKVSRATINKEIKKLGYEAELIKGEGYFYFVGKDVDVSVGIYVNKIDELSFEEWIEEFKSLIEE